ncbi:hypothetical protein Q9R19_04940 [Microbacterium sp. ARD32]|uniref:hypothetical protein n=1 Tax=Microbacterium sp. ARD32 TaxID=2962577 RepID=UPI00288182D0|nr:hypothetical protein [Microbacterium sp. ARD32]MDT0156971.1 hypothetical protein [Microbacterium sp. ARD32]
MKTRYPLAAGALLTVLSLTACGGTGAPDATAPSSAPQTTAAPPKAEAATAAPPERETTPRPRTDPTCDTIITEGTVEGLTSQGWTFEEREFRIGDVLVPDGLECLWADYSTASDHGQIYSWGEISAEASRTAQAGLADDGWLRSTEGDRIYLTEDPAYAIAKDEDGFGMTYEFGDGWVKFADTKQGLLLIDWGE